jgi:hypothetical protein
VTTGSALFALGVPLVFIALFAGAGSTQGAYDFGWEQKAGVMLGCVALWLGCIVLSGWRPTGVNGHAADAIRSALVQAHEAASRSAWHELSQTQTVRWLGVVQAVVILVIALGVLALTAAPWYAAVLIGVGLSIALNLAISHHSKAALRRERNRRSR